MFSFDFDYDLINILFLLIVYFVGCKIAKGFSYWKYAIWVIVLFVFVEGARYGRGVDYLHYIDVYEYDLEDTQVVFTWINKTLKNIGVTAIYAFGIYAIPFIIGGTKLLEKMKPYSVYMFPLFIFSYISFHETFIRQALATSFYFLYIVKLFDILTSFETGAFNKKAILFLAIYAILAISIHSIQSIAIVVTSVIIVFVRKPIHWRYTVPLLLLGKFYLASNFDWSYLNSLLNLLSGEEKLAMYADNADRWFSGDAMNDAYTRNIIIQYVEAWANCALLYLGYKVCVYLQTNQQESYGDQHTTKSFNIYVAIFNIVIVGCIILQTFYNLEIVRRVAFCWYLLWFVPLSVILYYSKKTKIFTSFDRFIMLGFFFWIWQYIRFLFVFKEEPMFIWDL